MYILHYNSTTIIVTITVIVIITKLMQYILYIITIDFYCCCISCIVKSAQIIGYIIQYVQLSVCVCVCACVSIYATQNCPKRTWQQMKMKYKNIVQKCKLMFNWNQINCAVLPALPNLTAMFNMYYIFVYYI